MALGDIRIADSFKGSVPTRKHRVVAGTTSSILAGTPVVLSGNYVAAAADGMPVVGTDVLIGIAQSTSTETATAAGTVDVYIPTPGVEYIALAKTPANINTDAKLLALLNHPVLFDLTAGVWTVDETTTGATYGLLIVDGNIATGEIKFVIREGGVYAA